MGQAVTPAMAKFLLVTMADCVNQEAADMLCWPSYAFLARRTGMNTKTVEAAVYRLKELRYIVDTGRRAGETGKVVVYRLNDPESGVIRPGPRTADVIPFPAVNDTGIGVVVAAGNPPKNGEQSPQKVGLIPPKSAINDPKNGVQNQEGTKKGTRKKNTDAEASVSSIPGVPDALLRDWLAVRHGKRATTLTQTVVDGLLREAAKAGLTAEEAVRTCIERNWISLNAGWLETKPAAPRVGSKHTAAAAGIFGRRSPPTEVIDV
jgi:hypothetical protein